jgi:hydrogenase nickel incorporation protein HypA/HybF
MHELSIATSIVDALQEEFAAAPPPRVAAVNLRIGALSGVVAEALTFVWEMAAADTFLAGARLNIEPVPATGYCPACAAEQSVPGLNWFACPACQGPLEAVTGGREMQIVSVEVLDGALPPI